MRKNGNGKLRLIALFVSIVVVLFGGGWSIVAKIDKADSTLDTKIQVNQVATVENRKDVQHISEGVKSLNVKVEKMDDKVDQIQQDTRETSGKLDGIIDLLNGK